MDFLVKVSPSVNWKHKQVTYYVGSKKYILPTCNIDNFDTICDDNQFAGLYVDNKNSNSEPELHDGITNSKISNTVATVGNA